MAVVLKHICKFLADYSAAVEGLLLAVVLERSQVTFIDLAVKEFSLKKIIKIYFIFLTAK